MRKLNAYRVRQSFKRIARETRRLRRRKNKALNR